MIMEGNMFSVEENLNISSWTAVVLGGVVASRGKFWLVGRTREAEQSG